METLPRGCGVVYRAFGARTALGEGRALVRIARRRNVMFFVGADAGLAVRLGANGVHLPERTAAKRGQNFSLKARFQLSAAAHDEPAVLRAIKAGVEAVVISPVFPSASPSAGRAMGHLAFRRLARIAQIARVQVYALGGVNRVTVRKLRGAGAIGVAAVSGSAPSKTCPA